MAVEDAVAVAMRAARREGYVEGRRFRMTVGASGDDWVVTLVFLPAGPGSDLIIVVSPDGGVEMGGGI